MTRAIAMMLARRTMIAGALLLAGTIALTHLLSAQELSHRLILKDGSYQLVTRYETKGDRVRYLSAERNEWEELPSSLVDWPATEKYEKERSTSAIPEASAIDKETDTDREVERSLLPEVAPGLRLPEESGVFLLDNFHGEAQLIELQQNEGDINRNTRSNIFRGALNPIASAKQTVELEGEHAALHAHAAVPSVYISVEEDEKKAEVASEKASTSDTRRSQPQKPEQPEQAAVPFDRFRIVHVKAKGGKRIIVDMKRAVNGRISQDQNFVKTTIDRVNGGWLKLTPVEELAPGEYAVVEMKGSEGMNLYVWDFGVSPDSPANPNPWKPDAKQAEAPKTKDNQ